MHPIHVHLRRRGWRQSDLSDAVRRLGDNLSAGHLSDILSGNRKASVEMAEAISRALDGKIKPAAIVFWRPATPPKRKRATRAA